MDQIVQTPFEIRIFSLRFTGIQPPFLAVHITASVAKGAKIGAGIMPCTIIRALLFSVLSDTRIPNDSFHLKVLINQASAVRNKTGNLVS